MLKNHSMPKNSISSSQSCYHKLRGYIENLRVFLNALCRVKYESNNVTETKSIINSTHLNFQGFVSINSRNGAVLLITDFRL